MADDARKQPGPFDLRTIEQLVALMSKHDLSEIDLREGELRICLRRGGEATGAAHVLTEAPAPAASRAPKAADAPPTPLPPARQLHEIKSPAVGTFYAQEKPGRRPMSASAPASRQPPSSARSRP